MRILVDWANPILYKSWFFFYFIATWVLLNCWCLYGKCDTYKCARVAWLYLIIDLQISIFQCCAHLACLSNFIATWVLLNCWCLCGVWLAVLSAVLAVLPSR